MGITKMDIESSDMTPTHIEFEHAAEIVLEAIAKQEAESANKWPDRIDYALMIVGSLAVIAAVILAIMGT